MASVTSKIRTTSSNNRFWGVVLGRGHGEDEHDEGNKHDEYDAGNMGSDHVEDEHDTENKHDEYDAGNNHDERDEGNKFGYECTSCGRTFPTPYLLSSHTLTHSSTRPYVCPIIGCPRNKTGFKRKNEMTRHGLLHGSREYRCPFCPKEDCRRFARPDGLLR